MNPAARHSQEDVEDHILDVLTNSTVMTTAEITAAVKRRLNLTPSDRARAAERDGESKVDQIIANALQSGRRLCRDGLINRTGRGTFKITSKGLADRAEMQAKLDDAGPLIDSLFPEPEDD